MNTTINISGINFTASFPQVTTTRTYSGKDCNRIIKQCRKYNNTIIVDNKPYDIVDLSEFVLTNKYKYGFHIIESLTEEPYVIIYNID